MNTGLCPCLCGCPSHSRVVCAGCGCDTYVPDYVAGSEASGLVLTPAVRKALAQSSKDLALQLGHTGRPGAGRTAVSKRQKRKCTYCRGRFLPARPDARTCSGACRQARSLALSYEDDVDVPGPWFRHAVYSRDRALATGFGVITAQDGVRCDLRIRRAVRIAALRAAREAA